MYRSESGEWHLRLLLLLLLSKSHVLILASDNGSLWAFCKGPVGANNLEKVQTFMRIAFGSAVGFVPSIIIKIHCLTCHQCL